MSSLVRVGSVEELMAFRTTLLKFAESASIALSDAESELGRTLMWLEGEQQSFWEGQIRQRGENLNRAKEALRMKKLYKDSSGSRQSVVDEEKAVAQAMKRMAEAEEKLRATRKYAQVLHKEQVLYKGQTQRLATSVALDIPVATAHLGAMIEQIQAYTSLKAPTSTGAMAGAADNAPGSESTASMGRGGGASSVEDDQWLVLRLSTPVPSVRALAPKGDFTGIQFICGQVDEAQQETLAKLTEKSEPMDPATMIIVADAPNGQRIYFERMEPCFPGDSGWYLGPGDVLAAAAVEKVRSIPIADLLAVRPDFREILSLHRGTLVALGVEGIAAVRDPQNKDLLAPPQPES